MITPWVLNTAWMAGCWREAALFRSATGRVAKVQEDLLRAILRRNRDTAYGQAQQFGAIASPRAYQHAVPLTHYEDYAPFIERICQGEGAVLTRERVEALQPTSGTAAGEKLIPLTRALRRQFQAAVSSWMFDLLRHRPALRRGRAYWSISPALPARVTQGGMRIGFADDAAYLSGAEQWALRRLLVAPAAVAHITCVEEFRERTLAHLLAAADLALISVWSPTFLVRLLDGLEESAPRLCLALERGAVPCTRARVRQLRETLAAGGTMAEKLARVWPRLALISCWADAAAAGHIESLRQLFPAVEIQRKGLLATEGCVSIPLTACAAPVLAVRSHFFEFQESAAPHRIRLAHELETGGKYKVILTTGGGLYRYQLGDEIEVCGYLGQCPMLRFLGKTDGTSDLAGEKLSEAHVTAVLQKTLTRHGMVARFAMLAPIPPPSLGYRLYLQDTQAATVPAGLAADMEQGLCENPHYGYARQLAQLRTLDVVMLEPRGDSAWGCYERACLDRGQRLGNIKPVSLDCRPGWDAVFARLGAGRMGRGAAPSGAEPVRSL